jgi:hypothetical protein
MYVHKINTKLSLCLLWYISVTQPSKFCLYIIVIKTFISRWFLDELLFTRERITGKRAGGGGTNRHLVAVEPFRAAVQAGSPDQDLLPLASRAVVGSGASLAGGRAGPAAAFLVRPLAAGAAGQALPADGQEVAVVAADARLGRGAGAAGVRTVAALGRVGQEGGVRTRLVDARAGEVRFDESVSAGI